jgi:hypothetical protein
MFVKAGTKGPLITVARNLRMARAYGVAAQDWINEETDRKVE